jgi:hypothetical protein
MGSRNAMQALVPGRVVLVTNSSSGLPELGAICGAPAAASKGIQLGSAASSGACLSLVSCKHPPLLLSCSFNYLGPMCE